MDAISAIKSRVSSNSYDTMKIISDDEITSIISDASNAPSSLNLQPWRFIAVTNDEAKQKLKEVVFDQNKQKISDASVTLIVLGDLNPEIDQPKILERTIQVGIFSPEKANAVNDTTIKWYGNHQIFKREEAIRGASLCAMALMIAAEAKGFISGPMIGFDTELLQSQFEISKRFFPVMLITVGYKTEIVAIRKPRFTTVEILNFNKFNF